MSDRDLGEAARMIWGSQKEMQETFREWEAALVETMNKVVERAKEARSAPPDPRGRCR